MSEAMARRLLAVVLALSTVQAVFADEAHKQLENLPDHPIVNALEEALIAKHPVECAPLADHPASAISVYRRIGGLFVDPSHVDELSIDFSCYTGGGFVATLYLTVPVAPTDVSAGLVDLPGPIQLSWKRDDLRDLFYRSGEQETHAEGFDAILEDPFFTRLKLYYETHHGDPGCWSWSLRHWVGGGSVVGLTGEVHTFRQFLIDGRCDPYSALFKGRYFADDQLALFDEVVTLAVVHD